MKILTLAATAVLCVNTLLAVDVAQLKGLPRGVQNIKYADGAISTLVVVGKAAVPKALRHNPGRAAQYGGEKARSEAQFEFTRFLSTKCKWGKTSNGETAVAEAANSSTDTEGNETSTETSSFTETEMTKEQKEQSAQACVSGIQALWEGLNDAGEYVWVGAWNAKALASIKGMVEKMNDINAETLKSDQKPDEKGKVENGGDKGEGPDSEKTEKSNKDNQPDILKGRDKLDKGTTPPDANDFF